ncbi:MAG: ribonuclease E/G, partial [Betaproteobacteria bacterium]|nr:ribonuclease E/G [Betaproteobacteria bacterium]
SARATKGSDIEETALATNLEAADEVARQLRLRDLGGLIVIDFIDMESQRNQREVENRFREALHFDRARVQIGKISRFGLLELSRQRLQPSLEETAHIGCPRCSGTGFIRGTESTALHVLRILQEEAMKENTGAVHAQVPVDVASFLLNEKRPEIQKLEARLKVNIVLVPNSHLETPHYQVQRLRHDELNAMEHVPASYELVQAPAELAEKEAAEAEPQRERQQAVVTGITPAQPAPIVPEPVQAARRDERQVEARAAGPLKGGQPGFFARLFGWFGKKEEAAVPPAPTRPASGTPAAPRGQRGPRDARREQHRDRRPEQRHGGGKPEHGGERREPRGEHRGERRDPQQGRSEQRGDRPQREPRPAGERRPDGQQRGPRGPRPPAPQTEQAPAAAELASQAAPGSEQRDGDGERRGRRHRRDRHRGDRKPEHAEVSATSGAARDRIAVEASPRPEFPEQAVHTEPAPVESARIEPIAVKPVPQAPPVIHAEPIIASVPAYTETRVAPSVVEAPVLAPTAARAEETVAKPDQPAARTPSAPAVPPAPLTAPAPVDPRQLLDGAGLVMIETKPTASARLTQAEEEEAVRLGRPRRERPQEPAADLVQELVQVETRK